MKSCLTVSKEVSLNNSADENRLLFLQPAFMMTFWTTNSGSLIVL